MNTKQCNGSNVTEDLLIISNEFLDIIIIIRKKNVIPSTHILNALSRCSHDKEL